MSGLSLFLGVLTGACTVNGDHLNLLRKDGGLGGETAGGDAVKADTSLPQEAAASETAAMPDLSPDHSLLPDIGVVGDLLPFPVSTDTPSSADARSTPGADAVFDALPRGLDTRPDSFFARDGLTPDAAALIDAVALDTSQPDTSAPITNLSQGKPAMASAEQDGKEAIYGNDGVMGSSYCNKSESFPAWWRVDLGATFSIVRAEIAFESAAVDYQYKIEISDDDVSYTSAVDQDASVSGPGVTLKVPFTARARYVRITILASSKDGWWPCLREFSVWGHTSPDAPVNLAPSGTAYRWYGNTEASSNANRVAEPKLNDDSLTDDVSLAGEVYPDRDEAYEAAGVVFARAFRVASVVLITGDTREPGPFFPGDPDGNFTADLHLQVSTDGTTWTERKDWTLAPAYPYDATARNRAFVFTGAATSVRGVRVTGLVHPDMVKSAYARAREVQVWGSSAE